MYYFNASVVFLLFAHLYFPQDQILTIYRTCQLLPSNYKHLLRREATQITLFIRPSVRSLRKTKSSLSAYRSSEHIFFISQSIGPNLGRHNGRRRGSYFGREVIIIAHYINLFNKCLYKIIFSLSFKKYFAAFSSQFLCQWSS